jgi:hypothetical protein
MSKYEGRVESIRKRIPRPKEEIFIVTEFSDGKHSLGMGRGNLLTEDEYLKLSGKIIKIDWGIPYDESPEIEKRPRDSGGNKESEEQPVQDPERVNDDSPDDDSPELRGILDRIRARRGETRDDDGAHAETMP